MKIYISSSWKQRCRVRALAVDLQHAGHLVYDFTDPSPSCRNTPEIPPEQFPEAFDPAQHSYLRYLARIEWRGAVMENRAALEQADLIVLLLPCGNDAHSDWAYGVGRGAKSLVVGHPGPGERVPTHLWADQILEKDEEVLPWIKTFENRYK